MHRYAQVELVGMIGKTDRITPVLCSSLYFVVSVFCMLSIAQIQSYSAQIHQKPRLYKSLYSHNVFWTTVRSNTPQAHTRFEKILNMNWA